MFILFIIIFLTLEAFVSLSWWEVKRWWRSNVTKDIIIIRDGGSASTHVFYRLLLRVNWKLSLPVKGRIFCHSCSDKTTKILQNHDWKSLNICTNYTEVSSCVFNWQKLSMDTEKVKSHYWAVGLRAHTWNLVNVFSKSNFHSTDLITSQICTSHNS